MKLTDDDIQRFLDAVNLQEYLEEQEILFEVVRELLESGVMKYPEWLEDVGEPPED